MKGTWLLEDFTFVQTVQIGHEFVADSNIISPFCLGAFFHWVLLK